MCSKLIVLVSSSELIVGCCLLLFFTGDSDFVMDFWLEFDGGCNGLLLQWFASLCESYNSLLDVVKTGREERWWTDLAGMGYCSSDGGSPDGVTGELLAAWVFATVMIVIASVTGVADSVFMTVYLLFFI